MQTRYFVVGLMLLCGPWFHARGMEAPSAEDRGAIWLIEKMLWDKTMVTNLENGRIHLVGQPLTTTVVNVMLGASEPTSGDWYSLKPIWENRSTITSISLFFCTLSGTLDLSECAMLNFICLANNPNLTSIVGLEDKASLEVLDLQGCPNLRCRLDLSKCVALRGVCLCGTPGITIVGVDPSKIIYYRQG